MRPVQEREDRLVESPAPVCEENVSRESNASPSTIHEANDMLQEEFHDASADPLPETSCPPETEVLEDCPVVEDRRYPTRDRKPPDYFSYHTLAEDREPQTYSQAMRDDDADKWKSAMQDEYDSLMKMNTWKLVDRPDRKIIPCKWVYKLKTDTHAAEMDLKMHHLDVDTAFLNGDLEEEVYMDQPQGFVKKGHEDKVCLLQKSLYGLKQAPRAWNIKLNETLSKIGFNRLPTEPCVYKKLIGSEIILLAIFVDDLIIFYKNDISYVKVKSDLQKYFSLKDLGPLKYYLGINIDCNDGKVTINQKSYITSLLKKYALQNAKEFDTPLANSKLAADSEGKESTYDYQQIIGCLMYLAVNTRPDIAFAASYLSQFNTKCGKIHWLAAKRVLQYLKRTIDYSIIYRKTGKPLMGYTDADWANCTSDRRSYTGYCFKLADGPVSWASKKQPTVALSSTEAEYMALTEAAKEATYLRRFIAQVCSNNDQYPTITLYSDSQSAQNLAYNPVNHGRTKHIDTKFHFIREKVSDNIIKLKFISSSNMSADVLTKCLGKTAHQRCIQGLGLINLPS
ncbi:UDP-galactose 4'-epimerase isoform X1 [Choristoneura fumiferana]|uniref:UDP-galactose 4'-epimerase isoform X1 n=1 Tax=Choristoneura fumiferana TaxID=7141 RepID=UPI003D15BCB1